MKRETYECGEPSVGSADIQFDIRFYVVALVFLIFDVEVALFFPWATVFGKATHLASAAIDCEGRRERLLELGLAKGIDPVPKPERRDRKDVGTTVSSSSEHGGSPSLIDSARGVQTWGGQLAGIALCDILVFFGVLMVGFAYVWFRGDLTWVRAVPAQSGPTIGGSRELKGSPLAT